MMGGVIDVQRSFPAIPTEELVRKLKPPTGKVSIVLDTDTYNEIDDQFAVIHSLLSPDKLDLQAIYAAPFHNQRSSGPQDGMEKSYEEIVRILKLMEREDVSVYAGSCTYLPGADRHVDSEAASNLVTRAMARDKDDPLYVVAIGAITNVASAIMIEPRIIERIVVVWLGGHALEWPDTREFNLAQDLHASRVLFDCGVPLMLVPCNGVASHLMTTRAELAEYVKPTGPVGQYLYETFDRCRADHFGYSRVIWDLSVIAWLLDAQWVPSRLAHSPRISEDFRWCNDTSRHLIRVANYVYRDAVFQDLFRKLAS